MRLVAGVEVWIPEGEHLVLETGAYAQRTDVPRPRTTQRLRYGEGLPGAAWATQRALVWRDASHHLETPNLTPTGGIGIPWFRGARSIAVVKLVLNAKSQTHGCLELWRPNEALGALKHEAGHYPRLHDFEKLSHLLQFPRGTGLPGATWESGDCQAMPDITRSTAFVRAELAERAGLKAGIGIPIYYDGSVSQVITLLAGNEHPFLLALDLFVPSASGIALSTRLPTQHEAPAEAVTLLATSAALRGVPATASVDGAILLALPIHDGIQLRSIACLTLS